MKQMSDKSGYFFKLFTASNVRVPQNVSSIAVFADLMLKQWLNSCKSTFI